MQALRKRFHACRSEGSKDSSTKHPKERITRKKGTFPFAEEPVRRIGRRESIFAWTCTSWTLSRAFGSLIPAKAEGLEGKVPLTMRNVLEQLEQEGIKEATLLIEELQKRGIEDKQAILEEESKAKAALERARREGEQEAVRSLAMGKTLCATPYGVDVVGISTSILAIGALVGGISARERKVELEKVNEKLRAVNQQLRQQTRKGMSPSVNTLYAPGLTYAPPGRTRGTESPQNNAVAFLTEEEAQEADGDLDLPEDTQGQVSTSKYSPGASVEIEPAGPVCDLEVPAALRHGKRSLRDGKGGEALVYFNKALMLTRQQGDKIQERRASRGIAAAKRLQGDLKGAINYQLRVLELSQDMQDYTGDSDALGTIADLYTELGDLETAGTYYDRYLAVLGKEIE